MDLVQIRTFMAIIEEKGLSAAARRLGINKSICSRRLGELETSLGVQLVRRSSRSVNPTDLGSLFYGQCQEILRQVETATALVTGAHAEVSGPLRITAPMVFNGPRFQPILHSFVARYDKVQLYLHFSDAREDLLASGFDAGIRIGELSDSALISKKVGSSRLLVCAAPSYLAERGVPEHPDALNEHECLMYSHLSGGSSWVFERDGEKLRKRLTAATSSNNGEFLCGLAEAGAGIVRLPDFIVQPALDAGRLRVLLADFASPRHGIYIIYPERRHLGASVRAFIDHVAAGLAE
ncbi:MAG: LysR family transcriptional regulator, partial [Rhodospirillaceae bacterium]